MGRLRSSLLDVVGVKFDRKLTIKRLSEMGVTDQETLKKLVDDMEVEHSRNAFIEAIKANRTKK